MTPTSVSDCGRFVVIDGLHIDRDVFDALARWARGHGLRIQDAIQLAVCAFNDRAGEQSDVRAPPKSPASSLAGAHNAPEPDQLERTD